MITDPPKGYRQAMHIIALNPDTDALANRGWVYISSGHFGRVLSHPALPGVVFKLNEGYGRHRASFDEIPSRDGYNVFGDYVMERFAKHGHCPYLPRIFHKVESTAGRVVWCIEELSTNRWDSDYDIPLTVASRVLNDSGRNRDLEDTADLIEHEPGLYEVLVELRELGLKHGAKPDLHGDNFMVRGLDFVLTDPFSFIRHPKGKHVVTRAQMLQRKRRDIRMWPVFSG